MEDAVVISVKQCQKTVRTEIAFKLSSEKNVNNLSNLAKKRDIGDGPRPTLHIRVIITLHSSGPVANAALYLPITRNYGPSKHSPISTPRVDY